VLRLVLVVVVLDVCVGDLRLRRDLVVELLGQDLRMEILLQRRVGEALLRERGLVCLLASLEVLLLQLLQAGRDVLGGDGDVELRRLLLELVLLHEVGDRLVLKLLVLRRPGLRKRRLPCLVRALRTVDQEVELRLRDRVAADFRDGVRRDARRAATAAGRDEDEGGKQGNRQEAQQSHVHPVRSKCEGMSAGGAIQAAWRASKIASTRRTAWENPSFERRLTSRFPTV